jgi:hypothetical protein
LTDTRGVLTRVAAVLWVVASGGLAIFAPEVAPPGVLIALFFSLGPWWAAWRAARGTALRGALAWAAIAIALGIAVEFAACFEPLPSGRPVAGHLAYLATIATLAALVSVLNARTPGSRAWAVLMAVLVLVFLIPWLEGPGLGRGANALARLRLDNPWTLFFGLLVVAGVTNYLPTRYGPAAAWLTLGFALEYVALTRSLPPARRAQVWAAAPWTLAAAAWTAALLARRVGTATSRLEGLWLGFRDHWGVVWALRVMERFNRSAESFDWPIRLAWQGVVAVGGRTQVAIPEEADAVLRGLLRRFAEAEALDRVASISPCQPGERP